MPPQNHPDDGLSTSQWLALYAYALDVLPLFDQSSIPTRMVVNPKGRCFLVGHMTISADFLTLIAMISENS